MIDIIKEANCPVVAHNAAYDIFHTVDQFWQYLPNDVEEFKKVANSMWPHIVDTKYLAEYHPALKVPKVYTFAQHLLILILSFYLYSLVSILLYWAHCIILLVKN